MASFMSSPLPAVQDSAEAASQQLDFALRSDANYEDLAQLLQITMNASQPSESGRQESDYPSLSDSRVGLPSMREIGSVRRVPLPVELMEQFGHMQSNCIMGLFPEISRAWLCIDSDIFVWNYEDGSDLAYFDGLNETILCAGLIKPKPGIFQPHIHFLLCLTTPVDIILLGVSFARPMEGMSTGDPLGEMHLLPEPLFSLPTDSVAITSVTGSENGRIFMAGKDGCLYELIYQAEDGWFSRKCRKVNHSSSKLSYVILTFLQFPFLENNPLSQIEVDNTRNILYTRSEKGDIQVYDMGSDGLGMSKVASLSIESIQKRATELARTIEKTNFSHIVHIAAITLADSVRIHLLAVTHSGMRLYFSTNIYDDSYDRPYGLALFHVRLPPGFSGPHSLASGHRPVNTHHAIYSKGTLILTCAQPDETDALWVMSPDSFPFQHQLMETFETTTLDVRTWTIAEIPSNSVDIPSTGAQLGGLRSDPPLVVTQHMQPLRRFVILNSQGSLLLTKLQPVDQLRQILQRWGPDSAEVKGFFRLHKEEQACATCLILACATRSQTEKQMAEDATRAFFLHGGEAGYLPGRWSRQSAYRDSQGFSPSMLSATSPTAGGPGMRIDQHGTYTSFATPGPHGMLPTQRSTPLPSYQSRAYAGSSPGGAAPQAYYSGKHNGICLYLGRILRPLWDSRMVTEVPRKASGGQQLQPFLASRFSTDVLSWILEQLIGLREFLERNMHVGSGLLTDSLYPGGQLMSSAIAPVHKDSGIDDDLNRKMIADAQNTEKTSLQHIQRLVTLTCECLALWKVLCDHQFHIVASLLSQDQQNIMRGMTFRNFVITGTEMAGALVICLINRYISDNAAVDAISTRLREVCPGLYSHDDAVCSKANEVLQIVQKSQSRLDRELQLQEALMLYKEVAANLDILQVCNQFATARYFTGIVDLALTSASKRDPQDLALHYYRCGEPQDDIQGRQAYMGRMDCYRCILDALRYVSQLAQTHPQATSVPQIAGPPPPPDPNQMTSLEAEQHKELMFSMCIKSTDELFHTAFYDWMVQQNWADRLLEINSSYLEGYLKRCFKVHPDRLSTLDLLWRYYEKTGNYSAASHILAKLAERHGTDVELGRRIEYLSHAVLNGKSSTLRTAAEGQFLHDVEEKLEVARIQLQILEAIRRLSQGSHYDTHDAISRLNAELYDISALYGDFAEPFDLSECKLAIVYAAGHYEPALVETLWNEIIEKELESTSRLPASSQMTALRNKFVSLGKEYRDSDRFFPLVYLVRLLERTSCKLGFDLPFVYSVMMMVGVPLSRLVPVYDGLIKSKDPSWQTQLRKPFHLHRALESLLNHFCENPSLVPSHDRRAFVVRCQDIVSSYLVELQASAASPGVIQPFMEKLRGLQAKLERCF